MHSRIFQISTEPIVKENYLNEDTLYQGDGSFYDYCSNIDDIERKENIACLVKDILPMGMFELLGDDAMRYNGGLEQWKEEYVTNIHKRADALTVENMLEWSSTYYLKRAIINPLDTEYHFYLDGRLLSGRKWMPVLCRTILCLHAICKHIGAGNNPLHRRCHRLSLLRAEAMHSKIFQITTKRLEKAAFSMNLRLNKVSSAFMITVNG